MSSRARQRKPLRFRYRKVEGYESAYEVWTYFGVPVGEVDRNGPNDWVAETHDEHRGFGRTRDAAVNEALQVRDNARQERTP